MSPSVPGETLPGGECAWVAHAIPITAFRLSCVAHAILFTLRRCSRAAYVVQITTHCRRWVTHILQSATLRCPGSQNRPPPAEPRNLGDMPQERPRNCTMLPLRNRVIVPSPGAQSRCPVPVPNPCPSGPCAQSLSLRSLCPRNTICNTSRAVGCSYHQNTRLLWAQCCSLSTNYNTQVTLSCSCNAAQHRVCYFSVPWIDV